MARYIDADTLKTDILKKYRGNWEIPCSSEDRLIQRVVTDVRVLIERSITADVVPKSEVDKLELTLQGVMWSVDKWLDEADYDADPIKRAITMREKTLQIVENAKTEVAKEIFEEIEEDGWDFPMYHSDIQIILDKGRYDELKRKYTEDQE